MRGIWAGRGLLRRLRGSDADEGVALVMVVGTMLVLASLALVTLGYTMAGQKFARYDQDYAAAENAAQSGIDDFISRLNRDYTYTNGIDCHNVAWQGPSSGDPGATIPTSNPCGWTPTTPVGWLPARPGHDSPNDPMFHYDVDLVAARSEGKVALTVTGKANGVYRTLQTLVGKGGSTDYVYYTDFEDADPDNRQVYPQSKVDAMKSGSATDQAAARACGFFGYSYALHWWQTDSNGKYRYNYSYGGQSACTEIQFTGGDDLDGEVYTNDTIFSVPNGTVRPIFEKQVYTGEPDCKNAGSTTDSWNTHCLRTSAASGSTNKADFSGYKPLVGDGHTLDDTSAQFVDFPGCHYYGSTRIVFNGDGTMTVWNPKSVNGGNPPTAIAAPTLTAPTCGTLDALNSAAGATVPVPTEQVIYVAPSPSQDTAGHTLQARQCYSGELGGPAGRTLPLGTYTSSIPTAVTSSSPSYDEDVNMTDDDKYCMRGNLYAEGVIKGRVTLAAAESIVATGDLVLKGGTDTGSQDMLGLVATNSVEVMHPRIVTYTTQQRKANCGSTTGSPRTWQYCLKVDGAGNMTGNERESDTAGYGTWPHRVGDPGHDNANFPTNGLQIAGSIQTLQHSFWVQQYADGSSKGTLYVKGSIAQRWRGIVGTSGGSTGYLKDYEYDTRLKFTSPPYFPKWATSEWTLTYSGEINTPAGIKTG